MTVKILAVDDGDGGAPAMSGRRASIGGGTWSGKTMEKKIEYVVRGEEE